MSSLKQIEANRRNSLKSTGPTSVAGKAVSRMNALKTGLHAKSLIISGEKKADLEQLIAEYYADYHPTTTILRSILDDLILCEWTLRRLGAAEAGMWEHQAEDKWAREKCKHPSGKVATQGHHSFNSMQRRLDSIRRSRDRALAALRDQADNPINLPPQPEAPAESPSPSTPSPEIGFVPSFSENPASLPPNPPPPVNSFANSSDPEASSTVG